MRKLFKKIGSEFKTFITKGNVIDLAVGMIIGAAFTAIVNALVNSIFKPLINAIPMQDQLSGLITMLVPKNADGVVVATLAEADLAKSVFIDWGAFIMAIVNFFLTAIVLFAIVKGINLLRGGMNDVKKGAKLLKSLSKEEKAELKKNGLSRKEMKAIVTARAEAEQAAKEADAKAAQEAEAARIAAQEADKARLYAGLENQVDALRKSNENNEAMLKLMQEMCELLKKQ